MIAAIQVQYVSSACVVIRTPDLAVLCDPWFTDGVYDGAWHTFPAVADPLREIGDVDAVYVSHIHPDHYDPAFLRRYFARFGPKRLLIADHAPNHLAAKMKADGFAPQVVGEALAVGATRLRILPHATGASNIDSALIVDFDDGERRHTVVNANDIVFDPAMTQRLREAAGAIDLLLCGYTGAGPFPQTYFDLDDPALPQEAERKKQAFFDRYRRLVRDLAPRRTLPFAGQYLLGGRLAALNPFRGAADAAEVLAFDPKAVVLADGGAVIDTALLEPSAWRRAPYAPEQIAARIAEIAGCPMAYERLMAADEVGQLPLRRLFAQACVKARARSEVERDYRFAISLGQGLYGVVDARRGGEEPVSFHTREELEKLAPQTPLSRVEIEPRYLFGLLTHVYHWNNAEVGSGYMTRRSPNIFDRTAQAFLNGLTA